jgi:uncharacterized integral membrane protein (TIGR00698 family)
MSLERAPSLAGLARKITHFLLSIGPGLLLCVAIALLAMGAQYVEEVAFAHPYVEALVIAILVGTLTRSYALRSKRWTAGINFGAKTLLEIAIVLLGASISTDAILKAGPALLSGIVATVTIALFASYYVSRLMGLSKHISLLIACGNSICGNSAIAAVAPTIGATSTDIAASISITAVLGVVVVLGLPLSFPLFHLNETQYGTLAGLTVYAVPQVLATTIPIGIVATDVGTLVKLVRVLMLGPVVFFITSIHGVLFEVSGSSSTKKNFFNLCRGLSLDL